MLASRLSDKQSAALTSTFPVPIPVHIIFAESQFVAIVNKVRNKILSWSLELESKGILGDGLTFSQDEQLKASTNIYNIGSVGVLGDVHGKNVQIGNHNSILEDLRRLNVPEALTGSGELTYARCSCGVVGCGSDAVDVTRTESAITWTFKWTSKKSFTFDARQYDSAVAELKSDFRWETPERTAERLIRNIDFSRFLEYGLEFQWASGRFDNKVVVSFGLKEGEAKYQVLCRAPWENHELPSEAVAAIEEVLGKP